MGIKGFMDKLFSNGNNSKNGLIYIPMSEFGSKDKSLNKLNNTIIDSYDRFKKLYKNAHYRINNKTLDHSIRLDAKIDAFIYWYYENMVKGDYTSSGEYSELMCMKNFIEKMAVWYELRYPDYEINRLMHCCSQEQININDVMFKNNSYINGLFFDEKCDVKGFQWADFYNTNSFINSLPCEERCYLSRPKYQNVVYLDTKLNGAHLHLSKKGIVELAENISSFTKGVIKDKELKGLNVKQVLELFKERDVELFPDSEIYSAIKGYDNQVICKNMMLDSVMYRIIERGGNRIGPRRGFLFAKEFGRNIDIPMMYGIEYSDPGLRLFMNEYLKAGGSMDLECYADYFRLDDEEVPQIVTIKDMFIYEKLSYTNEEKELVQKLVNTLAGQIDYDVVNRERVKQLRLERKLKKNRMYG